MINRESGFHRGRGIVAGAASRWGTTYTCKKSAASPSFGGIHDCVASLIEQPALIFEGFHNRLWWEISSDEIKRVE